MEGKIGDLVKLERNSQWYDDIGESIGVIVATPKNGKGDYRVVYNKGSFQTDCYYKLHNCETYPNSYNMDLNYFREENSKESVLKKEYRGYYIEQRSAIIIEGKKGNKRLFINL